VRSLRTCLVVLALGQAALADHPPISDRNYALDLSTGAALGSSRIVGMGGTGIGIAEGSADMQINPASAAVRPSTSNGTWDWDWHLDWLSPGFGSDYDDNGIPAASGGTAGLLTAGVLGQYREWGVGLAFTYQAMSGGGTDAPIAQARYLLATLAVARSFAEQQLTLGIALRTGTFSIAQLPSQNELFKLDGGAIQLGGLYRPNAQSFRVGLSASLPVTSTSPTTEGCDPNSCAGYILPNEVVTPWEVGVGAAYRFGPSAGNEHVQTPWRDERAVTLAADVKLTGAVPKGAGLEEFMNGRLQPAGREVSFTVRGGAEYEWIPGWLKVRGGTYWEPSRFDDASGRLHLTFGLEGRIFSFNLWGSPYRVRVALTGDVARQYGNGALSIGFW
jgi:hypothetical protein